MLDPIQLETGASRPQRKTQDLQLRHPFALSQMGCRVSSLPSYLSSVVLQGNLWRTQAYRGKVSFFCVPCGLFASAVLQKAANPFATRPGRRFRAVSGVQASITSWRDSDLRPRELFVFKYTYIYIYVCVFTFQQGGAIFGGRFRLFRCWFQDLGAMFGGFLGPG